MNLKVVKNMLKRNGIDPTLVSSGARAIDVISANEFDVVLLDHMMPEMDGLETLSKLKEEGLKKPGTVYISLTANAVVGAREKYLEAGFDDYMAKPMKPVELEDMLAKYLPGDIVTYRSEG